MGSTSSLYAAIDLGSNSFHMLVVREVAGSIQTLTRIKRKVRLAAGLNSENALSNEAMERGWQCLRLFAERLQDIPPSQIRVVATATLRLAVNAGAFIAKAQEIAQSIIQQLDAAAPAFYNETDRAQGFMESVNRKGEKERFKFLSVGIGIVHNTQRPLTSFAMVSNIGSELKCLAKRHEGASYFVLDRRTA